MTHEILGGEQLRTVVILGNRHAWSPLKATMTLATAHEFATLITTNPNDSDD